MKSTLQYDEHLTVQMKDIGRHQPSFFLFQELNRSCLQQQGFNISFWRVTNDLGNDLGCLGVPLVPVLATTLLYGTNFQNWRLHLVMRDVLLVLSLPHYLVVPFG